MQQNGPEVLVKFQNGDVVAFGVGGHEEFEALVNQLASVWTKWLYIGSDAAVRKNTVNQVYYYPEGYAKSR